MQLFLMRHGETVAARENSEQPLSRVGIATIQATAQTMKRFGLDFSTIVCSRLRRSHQSAALVAEAVRYPHSDIIESDTVRPEAAGEELRAWLTTLPELEAVLVVGHLPSLERLAALLLGGREDQLLLRFPNGGLTLLELDVLNPGAAELVFQLTPEQLRLLAVS